MASINDLPDEVLEFVMSFLPPYKDLEECSLVCRRWSCIVQNVVRYTKMNFNKGLADFGVCWKPAPPQEMTTITGRFSHSSVVHENSMFVFGGRSSATTTFNDLWCYDLSQRIWKRQLPIGTYPSPKACASMVNYNGSLVLFGGVRHPALGPFQRAVKLFDELHAYNINENRWTVYSNVVSPPPSAGHSASIRKNQMVVFGGFQTALEGDGGSNDLWCLDLTTWTWQKQETSRLKPPPRYGQFQITLDDDHLLVMGGCGGPNNIFSDAWLLDMSDDIWSWRAVEIRNKKFSASHMWCNPAAKVGSKLVVLGPTPALPTDFQIIKQQIPHASNQQHEPIRNVHNRRNNEALHRQAAQPQPQPINRENRLQPQPPRQPPPPPPLANSSQQIFQNNNNLNQKNIQNGGNNSNNNNNNQPQQHNRNNDEETQRLQRNLQQLRNRDDDCLLPKRFDEPSFHERFGMAAFKVQSNPNQSASRERQIERIRRMDKYGHELRRSIGSAGIQQQKPDESSSPKRAKRNCIAMFVCDLSNILASDSFLEWLEYKNYGIATGAPERLILSTIVAGKGELILFGGLLKETLTNETVQVSNSVHFLNAPRGVI